MGQFKAFGDKRLYNLLSKQYKINQSVICLRKKNRFEIKN